MLTSPGELENQEAKYGTCTTKLLRNDVLFFSPSLALEAFMRLPMAENATEESHSRAKRGISG